MAKPIKHIAVIRLSAMGDVAMTVPVLLAFHKQNPDIKITVVSKAFFKPLFDVVPNVAFFAANVEGKHKGLAGLLRLKSELQNLGIDAVADLHNVLRSKIVTLLLRIDGIQSATVDKARAEKKALTRSTNKIFKPLTPVTKRYAEVFTSLGFSIDLSTPEFAPKIAISENVNNFTGNKTQQWIGIAPFAKHETKVYPKDLMANVIDGLSMDSNHKIYLFGAGNDEVKILNEFASDKENIIVVAGKSSFAEEIALISNLDVILSMDSGNAHIAAIFGIPVITLWGATHPYTGFAPFAQPPENALISDREKYPNIPTSVYGNKTTPGYEDAMRTIDPKSVIAKVNSVL